MATSPGSRLPTEAVIVPPSEPDYLYRRQPLGLPAGSVRAVLALLVFGIIWAIVLLPEPVLPDPDYKPRVPLYLSYLMFLILGSYFATRGHAPATPGVRQHHPLYLPRGSLRFLMVVGFAAALGWAYYRNPDSLKRLNPIDLPGQTGQQQASLALLLLGAFFVGIVVTRMARLTLADSAGRLPAWFQDLLAWVALISVLGLGAEYLIRLVINPRVSPEHPLQLPHWEGFLSAFIGFYFGARSGS